MIERTGGNVEPPHILRHGGSDVAAVVASPFADTGLADDTEYRYRIGAVAEAEDAVGSWSEPVAGRHHHRDASSRPDQRG